MHDRVATVAAYGHAPDTAAAIRATGLRENQDVPLWLTDARAQPGPGLSIEQRLGRCSGALGVLQCAAAAA